MNYLFVHRIILDSLIPTCRSEISKIYVRTNFQVWTHKNFKISESVSPSFQIKTLTLKKIPNIEVRVYLNKYSDFRDGVRNSFPNFQIYINEFPNFFVFNFPVARTWRFRNFSAAFCSWRPIPSPGGNYRAAENHARFPVACNIWTWFYIGQRRRNASDFTRNNTWHGKSRAHGRPNLGPPAAKDS